MRIYFVDPFGVEHLLYEGKDYHGIFITWAELLVEHYYIGHRAFSKEITSTDAKRNIAIYLT